MRNHTVSLAECTAYLPNRSKCPLPRLYGRPHARSPPPPQA
ncbi:hypothetical protein EVA_03545 [gut metagenome]|uniref:Uncharacterized protein n=1 Tax=gut metagenome TaxID=749906 RepID=J9GLL1_9ZZZZ